MKNNGWRNDKLLSAGLFILSVSTSNLTLDGNHFESEKTHYSEKFIIKTFLNKEHFPLFPTRATDSKKK